MSAHNRRTATLSILVLSVVVLYLALPGHCDVSYTVRKGDSVWSIAKRFNVSGRAVLTANNLTKHSVIRPGRTLCIPAAEAPDEQAPVSRPDAERIHVVRAGENLWAIARRYGVSTAALAQANGLDPNSVLRVGQRLEIPGEAGEQEAAAEPPVAEGSQETVHVVQPGDNLWTIARRYGTTVEDLAQANGLRTKQVLGVGSELAVPGEPDQEEQTTPPQEGDDEPECYYVVEEGDSLWRIARRYSTSVHALSEANGLRPDATLRVGRRLKVPQVSSPAEAASEETEDGHGFVETALKYRGVRYRYGGMTTRGMDCSGLVARVLRIHGINAPHNSRALYKLGKPVSRSDLRSGDLVFFNTNGRGISHVGIYIGGGKFIHASSSKGRVRIDRMDQGYYKRRCVGARRIL